MKKFELDKIYSISGDSWKANFKVIEIKRDYKIANIYIGDQLRLELVNIECNYVGDMPYQLFDFLKNWFDYGYCNSHSIKNNNEYEFVNLYNQNCWPIVSWLKAE